MERHAQLHDRQIDQVAGKRGAPGDDDVALLGQHPNDVVQTGRSGSIDGEDNRALCQLQRSLLSSE